MSNKTRDPKEKERLTMAIVSGLPHNDTEWKNHCFRSNPLRFFGYKDKCWLNFATPMDALDFVRGTRTKTLQNTPLDILAAHMTSPTEFDQFALNFWHWATRHELASFYDIKP